MSGTREVRDTSASTDATDASGAPSPLWSAAALRRSALRAVSYGLVFVPPLTLLWGGLLPLLALCQALGVALVVSHLESALLRRERVSRATWFALSLVLFTTCAVAQGSRDYLEAAWSGPLQAASSAALDGLLATAQSRWGIRSWASSASALTLLLWLRLAGKSLKVQTLVLVVCSVGWMLPWGDPFGSWARLSPLFLGSILIGSLGWSLGFRLGDRWADRWGREPRTLLEAHAARVAVESQTLLDTPTA